MFSIVHLNFQIFIKFKLADIALIQEKLKKRKNYQNITGQYKLSQNLVKCRAFLKVFLLNIDVVS